MKNHIQIIGFKKMKKIQKMKYLTGSKFIKHNLYSNHVTGISNPYM